MLHHRPNPISTFLSRLLALLLTLTFLLLGSAQSFAAADPPPNIILIMADDLGYSDLGSYGGEIQTPNLDRLAQNGLRFRTFYNASKCAPTRSTLLTGLYQGNQRAINIAAVLSANGYTTIHSGKEHFERWVPKHCHAPNAFDHALHYSTINPFHLPPEDAKWNRFFDGERQIPYAELSSGDKPFWKTDFVTDYALKHLRQAADARQPFFLYLPYHAPHFPIQAQPEDIAKYRGKYLEGWDVLRQKRFERLRELGLIDDRHQLTHPENVTNKFRTPPRGNWEERRFVETYRPWTHLTQPEKDAMDLEMAVYAAMIDRMDQNIGRILQQLQELDLYRNTLILFLSDNGACPYDANHNYDLPPGPPGSYRSYNVAWAALSNTPYRFYKQYGHEGGARTPFIAHWPGRIEPGTITSQIGHIVDLFPTLLDVAGITYPAEFNGIEPLPLQGSSLFPIFQGHERPEPPFFISGNGNPGYIHKFRMYREGPWKIVRSNGNDWELFNLQTDPTETQNLALQHPATLQELIQSYQTTQEAFPK